MWLGFGVAVIDGPWEGVGSSGFPRKVAPWAPVMGACEGRRAAKHGHGAAREAASACAFSAAWDWPFRCGSCVICPDTLGSLGRAAAVPRDANAGEQWWSIFAVRRQLPVVAVCSEVGDSV